ncbi:MAG: redox-sensing transcriptional repressor Rex [Oscillospiraceae bacterium]|nr:redox-sensing transcriptional repressor Rex [Oscillospiraceae bacterium]
MANYPGVSISVIRRLPRYYRFLGELSAKGVESVSSREFARMLGLTASQIRQDLNCFGGFGQQGYGYNVAALCNEIGKILGLDNRRRAILIGAGNMGLALANHMRFGDRGFTLCAIFDNNPERIGIRAKDWQVQDAAGIEAFCKAENPEIAILCIPKDAAIRVANDLVRWGIRGFWNFSHYDLSVDHKNVAVENVHLGDSLMTLSYRVNEL